MTVAELIEGLKHMQQDAVVLVQGYEGGYTKPTIAFADFMDGCPGVPDQEIIDLFGRFEMVGEDRKQRGDPSTAFAGVVLLR